jgi:hypothetical protein
MISIINQIQASITGEPIGKLDMKEMQCDENNIEYIHDKIQAPPQTKP